MINTIHYFIYIFRMILNEKVRLKILFTNLLLLISTFTGIWIPAFAGMTISLSSIANAAQINEFLLAKPFPSPNIEFKDEKDVIHNLSDYKGKVVLINFWATWCEPCIHEMPVFEKLAKFVKGKNVEIVPISIDSKGASVVSKFYNDYKITNLPIYTDEKNTAFRQYKLQALPTSLVIDKRGYVVAKIMGEIDWNSKENVDYLLGL